MILKNLKLNDRSNLRCVFSILFSILLLCALSYGNPDSQTHKLDTATYYFQLENNSRLKFDSSWIYLGDSNGLWSWIGNDGIEFYNLEVDSAQAPNPWEIRVSSSTNITIHRLFKDGEVDLSITVPQGSNSTLEFSCGSRGAPHSVTGLDIWHFNSTTHFLNLTAEYTGSVLISWMGPYYYWPEPDQASIPIMAKVELPPVFHPSFIEFATNRISVEFSLQLKNTDTTDHTLELSYLISSQNEETIKEGIIEATLKADSETSYPLSFEIPFRKRDTPKNFTVDIQLTSHNHLIMDPIILTITVAHAPWGPLVYNGFFLSLICGLIALIYLGCTKWRKEHG